MDFAFFILFVIVGFSMDYFGRKKIFIISGIGLTFILVGFTLTNKVWPGFILVNLTYALFIIPFISNPYLVDVVA